MRFSHPTRATSLLIGVLVLAFVGSASLLVSGRARATTLPSGSPAYLVLGKSDFTSTGAATTQNGTSYPGGVAVDPVSGKVFIADQFNNRVLRFASYASLSNGANAEIVLGQTSFSGNAAACTQTGLSGPKGLAVDSAGRLWVADTTNGRVLRFDNAATLATGANASGVLGHSSFSNCFTGVSATLMTAPLAVASDSAGRLWVAEGLISRVLRFDNAASKANGAAADGVLGQSSFGTNTSATTQAGMNGPEAVAVDGAGRLWVADTFNNRVLRFDNAASKANGGNADGVLGQTTFSSNSATGEINSSTVRAPQGLAVEAGSGRLWVAQGQQNRVTWFDNAASKPNGGNADGVLGQADFTTVASGTSATKLNNPYHLAHDGVADVLWVADRGNQRTLAFKSLPLPTATPTNTSTPTETPGPGTPTATTVPTATPGPGTPTATTVPTGLVPRAYLPWLWVR